MNGPAPKWWQWAIGQLGVSEVPGRKSNPTVIGYRKIGHVAIDGDDSVIAWCAIFICAALEAVGIRSPRRTLARSFMSWGRPLSKPVPGCVVVLWREKKDGPYGHVGLLRGVSEDGKKVALLGGNQSNRVSIAWFPASRVLGYRWPEGVPIPADVPQVLGGGPVTVKVSET